MNIDVIDGLSTDEAMRNNRQILRGEIGVITVSDMVDKILHRLGSDKLRRLRVFGHGGAGMQGLGNSRDAVRTYATERLLTVQGSQLLHGETLRQLQGKFEAGGWVELRGCQVGSDSSGGLLLQELANLWGVPVKAGVPTQHPGGGFEGTVVVAWPNRPDLEFRDQPNQRPQYPNHWQAR